ncbi:MAG: PTS system nitrogen regulatory IIA component [Arenicella sp.]|jgi:PTS system nitrogen regulatory IIA component
MTSSHSLPQSVLSKTLDAKLISVNAEISSAKKLLEEMARLLTTALEDEVREKDIYHLLLEREKLGNTGIGNGVAVPHSRSDQANTAIVAIISLQQPVDFDSIDKQEVDLAFGLLVPKEASQEHLNLLADIARLVSDPDKKHQLSVAKTPSEVMELIVSWSDKN